MPLPLILDQRASVRGTPSPPPAAVQFAAQAWLAAAGRLGAHNGSTPRPRIARPGYRPGAEDRSAR